MLFKGSFTTKIARNDTKVNLKILNNYEVKATFTSRGQEYTFKMLRWKEENKKPISSFNKFAQLLLERFGDTSDNFGKVTTDGSTQTIEITKEQTINILKYACVDVFMCAEEIIVAHRRSLLDYCVYHIEREVADTYEKYIHLVACNCLVHSNFLAPSVTFPEVEFFSSEADYEDAKMKKFKICEEDSESDFLDYQIPRDL